ncbi:MAG: tripartite tricarboxylate transporter substrate binding protein [Rubrivivax sp.]|nr:tripartite tricarboxylate transporter substrate binding protein [Rubrivivax sp.]
MRQDAQRRRVLGGLGGGMLLWGLGAQAQDGPYPSKPIRIVPFGTAGGPIDAIARVYGDEINKRWGQPVIIDAKPGASGIVAADYIAKSAPDGYNLLLTLSLTHTTVPLLQKKVPYDPQRDFQPLTQIGTGGPMLVVPATNPANNLKELVAWGKAKGRVTYGTWGIGSAAHIMGELLKQKTGLPLEHVPYKGEAPAHLDMFGGVLDIAWANPSTAKGHLQAGKIKVMGITGSRRVGTLPQVPTFTEQGFDGFALDSWMGFMAPARMPAPLVDKLVALLRELTQAPAARDKLLALGFEPLGNTPGEFAANLQAEIPQWAAVIASGRVTME